MVSTFRGVLEFFVRLGIYDVILPFLLVFTVVFAVLEKSKVFGVEKTKDGDFTKKNINAMVAFVTAFFVVASSRLVAVINETLANMVLLLMLSVCFLILIGSFLKENATGVALPPGWETLFIFIMFTGLVAVFLNALGWLFPMWGYLVTNYDSTVVASIILIAGMVGFIYWITKDPSKKKVESE
ncbi:hypothetical protein HQ545_06600 [Candidatus Woesearchaeota archaeon]|nr:hypothetical protein [Candidatus Woesearchaeota archaeon]